MDKLTNIFREKNLKLTPQRYAIYKYLKSTKSHPSAEMIYDAIKADFPTMSLATVYKTVRTLIELGLVQEINVGEDNFRFDANVDNHPHIVCITCGKVDDIEDAAFEHLNQDVENFTNYKVSTHKLYFYGVCPECQKEL